MQLLLGVSLTGIFFVVLVVIASEKIDKVSITLAGVLTALFISFYGGLIEDFHIIYQWVDLELIMTIIGITLIMEMLKKSGLLEVFILYILRSIRGSFVVLSLILTFSVILLSMMITNVLALIIVSSITILIAQVAEFNPKPLLFLELVYSNLSGMLTPIASYTAAYVSLEQKWTYLDFLLLSFPYVGAMVLLTIPITYFMYKEVIFEMKNKEKMFGFQLQRLLKTIDPWSFVDSRNNFYKAIVIFFIITIFLAIGTSFGYSVDIICLFGGMTVLIFFSKNVEEFIKAIDWPMLVFLIGIFIMSGLIQITELAVILEEPTKNIIDLSPSLGIIMFSCVLGGLTSIIENIPLIFLLRPLIDLISETTGNPKIVWWAILAAVNITDSAVLISSVKGIYIMEFANREGVKIKFMEYLRFGFIVTFLHLLGIALYVFILLSL